ncbi:hypothetical protein A2881_05775 [Candidatus Peribacteria bacterium RIFCSPHIGHO2_01_FULL_55_13]|nr:MAG: hypothetical protein A2881_05775 [Candidatus Peribacteria bacterium RIFCSPHIGHO2_01_FULL_55_13]OGJ64314.1 MAG: hypothetical protein A3F36_03690 [Candidatus Peribacteria bacterium RIFCSPHIGHO2_12_FULL_55_11]
MKNRQMVVAALAGILTGTVIGAGTYFSAQVVSYRYSDRDTFRIIRMNKDLHSTKTLPTAFGRHAAAGKRNTIPEECQKFTRARQTRCIEITNQGADYQAGHE